MTDVKLAIGRTKRQAFNYWTQPMPTCPEDFARNRELLRIVDDAARELARKLCTTPTVDAALPVPSDIDATIYGTNLPGDAVSRLTGALTTYFATAPIADETGGTVYVSALIALFHKTVPEISHVVLTTPAADIPYAEGQVPTLGSVFISEA